MKQKHLKGDSNIYLKRKIITIVHTQKISKTELLVISI